MAAKRPHAAMNAKDSADDEPVDPSDELMFLALGGGNEVGRSCHIIQYKGKTVMLDAGIHPAYDGLAALPFYDEFDLSTVDVLLITHFHMDHAASLPYVLAKTNFQGRVYMTHPTKAIYKWLMQDSVRVQNTHHSTTTTSGSDGYVSQLFTEADILSTLPLIHTISFHTTHTHNGIRFTPYPAGHVLGACMYLIEIAGLNILFTGDYSRETDRHLIPAAVPRGVRVDCLITESTFGISTHVPRQERETALVKAVTSILNRGGRALLPVPAIGQGQEVLLILEDYWHRHPEFQRYPIYYASSLARKCMIVYQTYIDAMNESIRAKFQASQQSVAASSSSDNPQGQQQQQNGPWDFRYIRSLRGLERFDDIGGCVMLASPGMLQNGVSRSLLERWAPDAKNGLVITGYSVEGTMAKQIVLEPDSIPAVMTSGGAPGQKGGGMLKRPGAPGGAGEGEKVLIPRRLSVQEFSFAAHVDGQENREFIELVNAPVVVLVHGEKHNMNRLKSRLLGLQRFKVFSPANCEEVRIPFRRDKVARVVGRLASAVHPPTLGLPSPPEEDEEGEDAGEGEEKEAKRLKDEGTIMSGVLVQNDFKLSLMAPEDLKEYAGLATTTIRCRQRITLAAAGVGLIRWALEGTFGSITTVADDSPSSASDDENGVDGAPNGKSEDADEEIPRQTKTVFEVMGGAVRVTCASTASAGGEVELEWEGNRNNDSIADAVMAVLLTIESSPAAVKQSSKMHAHNHSHDHGSTAGAAAFEKGRDYDNFGDSPTDANRTNGFDIALRTSTFPSSTSNPTPNPNPNPLAPLPPTQKLTRLLLFLESQFGSTSITPISTPHIRPAPSFASEEEREEAEAAELARLHALGIPVPGLEVRVDKHVARVWLETGEVECGNKSLGDRVRAVVERGLEVVRPVWG